MPRVFISYRRDDSQDVTGRIYDRLAQAIAPRDIFRDVDSIAPGVDFRKMLEEAVARCDLVLVVIGPRWLRASDAQGRRRLDNPDDFVRIEVESALRRGVPVIPVTVSNATLPAAAELPESLKELTFRNGRSVRPDPDFHNDMSRLVREITTGVGASRRPRPAAVVAAAAVVTGAALLSWLKTSWFPAPSLPPSQIVAAGSPPLPAATPTAVAPKPESPVPRAPPGAMTGAAEIEWVAIPGGPFVMGDTAEPDSQPRHRVTVKAFELSKTEVTVDQYAACVREGTCSEPDAGGACNWGKPGRGGHPVNCVDWAQAGRYAAWAGGRLPSEAEWEYAARSGGKGRRYPWGSREATCGLAVFSAEEDGCGKKATWLVCSKPKGNTEQGLCDMAGNVLEWTRDGYHARYDGAPADASAWENPADSRRVFRGGSWSNGADAARVGYRYFAIPGYRDAALGFRVCR